MDTTKSFTFEMPSRLVFGVGSSQRVGEEMARLGSSRVLVVTDPGLMKTGIPEMITGSLGKAGIAWTIFSDVEPNPSVETVEAAFGLYREHGANGIVAVGGGSSIDTAKAVGVLAVGGGSIRDYEGIGKVKGPLPPLLAVPTTCGTGAEVTHYAVITDKQRKFKMTIGSAFNIPKVAVVDPGLLTNLPAHLVASTGMDALTHAIESYTNLVSHPLSEALNIQAIRMIAQNLRIAVANGSLSALCELALASTMTGIGFTNTRLGIVHAMSHPVGGHANVPHGVANAILLPHAMEYNLMGNPQKHAEVAAAMGEAVDGLSLMDAAWQSVEAVRNLSRDIGIPEGLRAVGVTDDMLEPMAEDAMKSGNIPLNPRRVTKKDILNIYKRAM